MVSLIITLFISLFSVCPAYYQLDQQENKVVASTLEPKYSLNNDTYSIFSVSEILTNDNILNKIVSANNPFFFEESTVSSIYNYMPVGFNSGQIGVMAQNTRIDYDTFDIANQYSTWFDGFHLVFKGAIRTGVNSTAVLRNFDINLYYSPDDSVVGPTFNFDLWYNDTNPLNYGFVLNPATINANYYIRVKRADSPDLYNFISQSFVYENDIEVARQDGINYGQQLGYQQALDDMVGIDTTASTIFEGIFDIGLLPINVFLTIFNFELFGVNISGIISGLLTLSVAIIVIRTILGGKKDD